MNADSISLIVPARNEGSRLKTFLSDLMIQATRLHRISQVVVVLDACADESAQIVREMALIWPPGCVLTPVVVELSQGKAHAVCCGLAAATGHFGAIVGRGTGIRPVRAVGAGGRGQYLDAGVRSPADRPGLEKSTRQRPGALDAEVLQIRSPARRRADRRDPAETAWLCSTLHAARPGGYTLEATLVREALRSRLYCYDVPVAYRPRSIAEGRGVRWYHLPSILRAAA